MQTPELKLHRHAKGSQHHLRKSCLDRPEGDSQARDERCIMKKCGYCGLENKDGADHCQECGTEFELAASSLDRRPSTAGLNLEAIEGAFTLCDGFSIPSWPVILDALRPYYAADERLIAWSEVMAQWASRWQSELGSGFRRTDSGTFFLVSQLEVAVAEPLLQEANGMVQKIRHVLDPIAWEDRPYILIVHVGDEALAARFLQATSRVKQNTFAGRRAVELSPHWILQSDRESPARIHDFKWELIGSCLSHLPLPDWLRNGVATQLWRALDSSGGRIAGPLFDEDLIPEHRRFWNESTIQSFWSGSRAPEYSGDFNLYSELSNILVQLLIEKTARLVDFLRCAHYYDAGQSAALSFLKMDLGELAATFLGPGHWAPDTLAIAECWDRRPTQTASEEA